MLLLVTAELLKVAHCFMNLSHLHRDRRKHKWREAGDAGALLKPN